MKDIETMKCISENSKYVFIDTTKIDIFLNGIKDCEYHYWFNKEDFNLIEEEIILFCFICESMNFCFWKNRNWKVLYNGREYIGSETLFHIILKEIEKNDNFLNIEFLKKLKYSKFKEIMTSNNEKPDLLKRRFKLLKKTVNVIGKKGSRFYKELFSLNSDEGVLNYIVKNFKHFDDKSKFKGRTIHFNKKAILLTNDLFRLSETIKNNIKSINNLTGGADYAIPKVLYELGIFRYDDKLLKTIKNGKMIRHNSRMEIEIRANTLYVLEIMHDILESMDVNIATIELDNIIWNRRKKENNKNLLHHTKTIYY